MTEPIKILAKLTEGNLKALREGKALTLDSGLRLANVVPIHIILKMEDQK